MSLLGAVLIAGGAAGLAEDNKRPLVAGAALVTWLQPLVGVAGLGAASLVGWRSRLQRRRLAQEAARADVALLAELVGLGLTAGLSLHAALATARRFIGSELTDEVDGVLRRARGSGLAAVLSESAGAGEGLYRMAARAVSTGAPLVAAVDGFVHERLSDERAARLAEARRLPVRLMVPLALLILPGFVLMTLAPALASTLNRLVLPI